MSTLAAELEFVKNLAREAAQIALERAAGVTPHEKDNLSYVTDLDHDLERLIRARLASTYPNDVLTGEEYASGGGKGPRRWSIDPIDGTGNLVHALPLWAISIGLLDAGEPVLGVIAVPPLQELFWAVKGEGAWRVVEGNRNIELAELNLSVRAMNCLESEGITSVPELVSAIEGQTLNVRRFGDATLDAMKAKVQKLGLSAVRLLAQDADTFHNQDNVCLGTNAMRAVDPRSVPGRLRDLGSACCELTFTASNRLQACTFLGEAAHDVAAGAVIAGEAGCRFGTIDGRLLTAGEFVAETPVSIPTFIAPPRRLRALQKLARRL